MKIDVTYEKGDILRLVFEDLKKRQIKVKVGTLPEYKGALHVKLAIDAEDEDVEKPREIVAAPVTPPPSNGEKKTEPEMADILQQSQRVQATVLPSFKTDGPLQRQLGAEESLEFPKE